MSHDPLCPEASGDFNVLPKPLGGAMYVLLCECDLIARVRADNDREWLNNRGKSMVYAAALRDVVKVVKALPICACDKDWETGEHQDWCAKRSVVAAIEALGDAPPRQPKEHINPAGYDPAATDNRP